MMNNIDINYVNSLDAAIIQNNSIGNRMAVDNLMAQRNQYFLSLGLLSTAYQIGCFLNNNQHMQQNVQQNSINNQLLYNNNYNQATSNMGSRYDKKQVSKEVNLNRFDEIKEQSIKKEYEYILATGVEEVIINNVVNFKGSYIKDNYHLNLVDFKVDDNTLCDELIYLDRLNTNNPLYKVTKYQYFLINNSTLFEIQESDNNERYKDILLNIDYSNINSYLCNEIINHTEYYSMDKLEYNYKSLKNLYDCINNLINGNDLISDRKRCLKEALNHFNNLIKDIKVEKYKDNILKLSLPITCIFSYHDILYRDIVSKNNQILLVDEYSHEPLFNILSSIDSNIIMLNLNSNTNKAIAYRVYIQKEKILLCKV